MASELDEIFPDGITLDDPDTLVSDLKAAGERLSDEDFEADKAALDKAIASNERLKVILAVGKMAADLGMKFV